MSVQTQIDRISAEVGTQTDLISQIKAKMGESSESTVTAYGQVGMTVSIAPSSGGESISMEESEFAKNISSYTCKVENGDYIITYVKDSVTSPKEITVSGDTTTTLLTDSIFTNTWEAIEWASKYYRIPDTWLVGDKAPVILINGESYSTRVIDIGHEGKGSITFAFDNAIGDLVYGCESVDDTYKGNLPTSAVMELPTVAELGAKTSASGSVPTSSGTIYSYYALNTQTSVLRKTLKGSTAYVEWWAKDWATNSGQNYQVTNQYAIRTTGYSILRTVYATGSASSATKYQAYISPIFYFE